MAEKKKTTKSKKAAPKKASAQLVEKYEPGKVPFSHKLTKKQMEELYRFVVLTRTYEDKLPLLYRQGRLFGGVYRAMGHEAISVGTSYALDRKKGDIIAPLHRGSGAHLVFGQTLERMYCNYMGRACGPTRGRDGNVHHGDASKNIIGMISHLGSSIPLTVGAALGKRMQGENIVALTYIGDGATSIGEFHEGLNFAAVHKAPIVLVIENNQYAYSTPRSLQYNCADLIDRAIGYGIRGIKCLGVNVFDVYQIAKEAVDYARSGKGPVLLELETMRFRGHSEHDNFEYVPKEVLKHWEPFDPVKVTREHLIKNKIFTEKKLAGIDAGVKEMVDKAADWAYDQPFPEGESILEGVYEEVNNG